ncbi:MAG: flavin reductase family protein, partial [Acidimicrobiaceae bacterium]|nr:flavin reductase family protein [Acidimicrobiaceae bacterium]
PLGPFPPGTEPEEYDRLRRRVLWMMPSGLYLLGSRAGESANLMTLNWAIQVSTDPKLVAVSVEVDALTHRLIDEGGHFALSLLGRADRAVVRKFVKPAAPGPGEAQLNGFAVRTATTGSPILAQARAWIDCEVTARQPCGSHTLFIGQVVDAGLNDGPGRDEEADEDNGILRMEDTRMSYGG